MGKSHRLDPLVHNVSLVDRHIHIHQTAGTRGAQQRDLLIVRDHGISGEVVRVNRHHIADRVLNTEAIRHQQLRLLLQDARKAEEEESLHTERQNEVRVGNAL